MSAEKLEQGKKALQQGNKQLATKLFSEAAKENPTNDDAWVLLASSIDGEKQKRYCLQQAIKANPNNLEAQYLLKSLASKEVSNSHQVNYPRSNTPNSNYQTPHRRERTSSSFQLLGNYLTPAEDEVTIRTYHCTSLSSWILSLKAQGYLVVTNKRVIFHAQGKSLSGKSILQSETPIEDVSGISHYKGTFFSFSRLITAILVMLFASTISGGLFAMLISMFSAIEPSLTNILQIAQFLVGLLIVVVSFLVSFNRIWRPTLLAIGISILGTISTVGLAFTAVDFGHQFNFIDGALLSISALLTFALSIYSLYCIFRYSRRETIAFSINSKGGSSTPIAISGNSGFGQNTVAVKALTADPGKDAEIMIKELGAMITDIQTLGDHGISKWEMG